MQNNIIEYLETSCRRLPDKVVYRDETSQVTFSEVMHKAKKIGSFLAERLRSNSPVVVISDKCVNTPIMYLGVLYSGCFYVPIGIDLPQYRMNLILETVDADLILVDSDCMELAASLNIRGKIISIEEALEKASDEKILQQRREQCVDTDPAYVIFTSGSTGKPKGVIESHRALIDYIDVFAETFDIEEQECFGNQAPLDYIAAIRDIYLPLKVGASALFIPKKLFSMPARLFDFLNENKVTTLCWVVSAFGVCCDLKAFEHTSLEYVQKVFFTGAVMPCRHLRTWQMALPEALFVNHYGPTEITASCTYHIVDHVVNEDEVLPIGKPFRNTGILLLKEDGSEAEAGEQGEICVKGTCLALGYYKNPEKTNDVFVRNPLNDLYHETIYRTGDIGAFSDEGILQFRGRMDSQIKHAGHRIELGEIEGTVQIMDGISECACLYDTKKEQLWLFFTGKGIDRKSVAAFLKERLPSFMIPRKIRQLEEMPKQFNGKIDMSELKKQIS